MTNQAGRKIDYELGQTDIASDPSYPQRLASAPESNCWVGASAGSGKTKVLIDRLLRLLLQGAEPSKILCLTFTKAAATEMANRLQDSLANWAKATTAELSDMLLDLMGHPATPEQLQQAQTKLFTVMDCQVGVRFQTIHSFCQELLAKFPIEAAINPNFSVLDEEATRQMLQSSVQQVLAQPGESGLVELAEYMGEYYFQTLLNQIYQYQGNLRYVLSGYNTLDDYFAELKQRLQINASQSELLHEHRAELQQLPLQRYIEILQESSTKLDQDAAKAWQGWLSNPEEELERLFKTFFTAQGVPRKRLLSKAVSQAHPELLEFMIMQQQRLEHLRGRLYAIKAYDKTCKFLTVILPVFAQYQQQKALQSSLDYFDLIIKTQELLQDEQRAAWVFFKLDGGLDHILVDEAQDTSPEQWDIILSLVRELYQQDFDQRSFFVVGDAKQSIYGFQGAHPQEFLALPGRQLLPEHKQLQTVGMSTSFRSTKAVLEVVDKVFQLHPAGVCTQESLQHKAWRSKAAGRTVLWPLQQPAELPELEPWPLPDAYVEQDDNDTVVAKYITSQIQSWLQDRRVLAATGKPVEARDIMILVQRRGSLANRILQALAEVGIPTAGQDRLSINRHIIVQDLLALAQFALLPSDDYSLACLLKSALVAMTEERLFELANHRDGSLWQALQAAADDSVGFLKHMLSLAGYTTCYEFFAQALQAYGKLHCYRTSFGDIADDIITSFLDLCLQYDKQPNASLQGLIDYVQQGNIIIKRQLDPRQASGVQVMTVHGSKGLQAPIVILADAHIAPSSRLSPLLWGRNEYGHPDLFLLTPPKAESCELALQLRDSQVADEQDEYNRLLYVAMTRAEDELYIAGVGEADSLPENCWYNMVSTAMQDMAIETETGLVYQTGLPVALTESVQAQEQSNLELPAWVNAKPDGVTSKTTLSNLEELSEAQQRGIALHKLLEHLPNTAGDRTQIAHKLLKHWGYSEFVTTEDTQALLDLMNKPEVSELLTGGVAEAKFCYDQMTGRMDRVIVSDKQITIIDFKSGRSSESLPTVYQEQLTSYVEFMRKLYPSHEITAKLIWLDSGRVDSLYRKI